MDAIIKYKKNVPLWKTILGVGALIIGALGLLSLILFAVVPIVLGLMLLKTEGSEINLESKTFRITNSILGITHGNWQVLQNPEYISVFNTTESITVRAVSAETTNSSAIILLNIFYNTNQKVTVYSTTDIKEAFDVASHFADALDINLLDATTKNDYKWVDKIVFRENGELIYID
jgi:hypothetical protein